MTWASFSAQLNRTTPGESVTPTSPTVLMANTVDEISSAVDRSLLALQNWVEQRDYAGHEPFDILSSPLLRWRWSRSWPLAIGFIQFGKRFAGLRLRRW